MSCAITEARVDMAIKNNATWEDAFQFDEGSTLWTFTGQTFRCDIKASADDTSPLLSLTSGAGQIVVDDATNRILHFNVPEATIQANLPVATYVYDFVMIDGSTPAVRVPLMSGTLEVIQGVTGG